MLAQAAQNEYFEMLTGISPQSIAFILLLNGFAFNGTL
jgi:hypothetical protein